MRNWQRWAITIGLTFAVGCLTTLEDSGATLVSCLRHGAQALLPALVALKMTLNPDERRIP